MMTSRTRHLTAAFLAALVVGVGACDDSTTEPPDPVATEVEVTPADTTLTSLGATAQLEAVVLDQEGMPISGATVTWTTSDPDVATASSSGLVEAVGNGTATVTAASGSVSATATINVAQTPASIVPDTTDILLTAIGQTSQVAVTVADEGGSPIGAAELSWSSSDESVATVDASGVIEAVGPGTATITVTSGEFSAEIEVVVQPAAGITVEPSQLDLVSIGETGALTAVVTDVGGTEIPGIAVNWSSSDEAVAMVDSSGIVEAVANGSATITAEVAGNAALSSTVEVTVEQQASGLSVSPAEATLTEAGATTQLTAVVSDAEGNPMEGAAVVWTTSDAAVATVTEDGLVQAVANGVVTITATSGAASATAQITVDIDDGP